MHAKYRNNNNNNNVILKLSPTCMPHIIIQYIHTTQLGLSKPLSSKTKVAERIRNTNNVKSLKSDSF